MSYWKTYNYVQTNVYYQTEIISLNHIIVNIVIGIVYVQKKKKISKKIYAAELKTHLLYMLM